MRRRYHWMSMETGEIVRNLCGVIRAIIIDRRHFRAWNMPWKYSAKGW